MVFRYSNALEYIVPDSDQVETFTPAMYSTHYCASPPLPYFITGDLVFMQGAPVSYV